MPFVWAANIQQTVSREGRWSKSAPAVIEVLASQVANLYRPSANARLPALPNRRQTNPLDYRSHSAQSKQS